MTPASQDISSRTKLQWAFWAAGSGRPGWVRAAMPLPSSGAHSPRRRSSATRCSTRASSRAPWCVSSCSSSTSSIRRLFLVLLSVEFLVSLYMPMEIYNYFLKGA